MVRSLATVGLVTASVVLIPACKGGEQKVDTATAPPAAPSVLTVHARDFAFDAPDTVQAGMTTIHLVNDGPGIHHAMLFRLDSGKTEADVSAALKSGSMPAWMVPAGGPNAIAPGDSTEVTQEIPAGNYLWTCFVDIPDHVPHIAKGMMRPMTVVPGSTAPVAAPVADIDVTLRDYAFDFSTPLTAGRHTFKVGAAPGQPHEMVLLRLAPGKTPADMQKYLDKPEGPPPAVPVGGVGTIMAGQPVYFTADITPGDYMVICFVPDAKDGKPHVAHGMMQVIHVS